MRRCLLWLTLLMALLGLTFAAGAVLAEGAIHPLHMRRASDTAAMAQSIASSSGARVSHVSIQAKDGTVLKAWWFVPPQPAGRGIMVCHGVADSAWGGFGFALLFLNHGYSVLVPESRGHGESGGFATYGVLEAGDAVHWAHWMQENGATSLVGFGESMGGAILLQSLAHGAPFQTIIAECSYASFEQVAVERVSKAVPAPVAAMLVKEGMLYIRMHYRIDLATARPDRAAAQSAIPILLIHGAADNETSPQQSEQIARANPSTIKLWIVPNARHVGAYATAPREFEKRVLEWASNGPPAP
jgi:alpha-beta hydrolase superfamily lysophospholipase